MAQLLTGLLGVLIFYWTPSGQSETSIFCSHGVRYNYIFVSEAADVCVGLCTAFLNNLCYIVLHCRCGVSTTSAKVERRTVAPTQINSTLGGHRT